MGDVPTLAPLFELPTSRGEVRSLAAMLEQSRVLLAFHRGTW
jgi:peroxiredoxin